MSKKKDPQSTEEKLYSVPLDANASDSPEDLTSEDLEGATGGGRRQDLTFGGTSEVRLKLTGGNDTLEPIGGINDLPIKTRT